MTHSTIKQDRAVAMWLLTCCALVFAMVVLGGVTRLTGSGLSMVNWRPVTGVLPPLTTPQWQEAFSAYRGSPEFLKINPSMDLPGFKGIFWLEYSHRLLGRTIGIVFLIPFLFFWINGYIARSRWPQYLFMFVLGGLQGVLGWYMVKSGLVNNPHVSQYRLCAHLVAAFAIYAYLLWTALNLLYPRTLRHHRYWFKRSLGILPITSITVISGAFVAGLKAGLAYNTFPLMAGHWIPPGMASHSPWWRNLFDNITTVQFDHRALAITTFITIMVYRYFAARDPDFPNGARHGANILAIAAVLQVSLGILTLLLHVPTYLAAAHQAMALLLFTVAVWLCHSVNR